jgi:3-hydroxyacyl-CoA dehydrogenase/3-hydroxy-2-methylbutyryl-CoA dehydrogenase
MSKVKGLTILVTGGASGLGEGTVRKFHKEGANVVILDLQEEQGQDLVKQLGERAIFVKCNVTSEEDGKKAISEAVKAFGQVNGLVNCAGVGFASKVVNPNGPHKLSIFEKVVQVNLVGTFNMLRLAAQQMSEQKGYNEDGERGFIINVASVAAYEGQIGQAGYSASKAGVVGMTLPIARELGRHGIRVLTIAPGLFETPMTSIMPKKNKDELLKQIHFPKRFGQYNEFADLCFAIATIPYLNGETIRIDGSVRMSAM